MGETPIERMVLSSVRCTVCGAGYGQCDCWTRCPSCGWSFRKGKSCRNQVHGGSGGLEVVAASKPRRRKRHAQEG